jgi:CheY-like chemotaxis protein
VKPSELLRSAAEAVRLEADHKGLDIEVRQGPGADLIYADPALMNQVLLNLLTNAIKFSNRGGKIQASTREVRFKDGKYCRFSVSDFGKGIDAKFLPKIFEQFSQQDSTSTRAHGGLGLGLAIVRGIVELHGGSVNAESAGVGKGATFNILLPMASKAHPSAPAKKIGGSKPRRSAVKLNGLRVMFVEDEASSRDAIGEILRGFGATVLEVESVEKAVKAFPVFRPAILLSDIAMPGRDGYSLIRHIRRLTAKDGGNTPSIALTAYANEEDRRRVLAAGFDAYLTKPLQTDALAALLTKKWTKSRH